MSKTAQKRLLKELQQLIKDSPPGIVAGPKSENNIFIWDCLIQGPPDTPYADGVFNAKFFDPIFYSLIAPSSMLFRNIFTDQTYFMISIAIGVTITAFVYYKTAQFLFFLLADFLGTLYFKKEVMILDGYDY